MGAWISYAGWLPLLLLVANPGCTASTGSLHVLVTDGPGAIDDFSTLPVKVTEVKVHRSGLPGGGAADGREAGEGWRAFPVPLANQGFDLKRLLDGNTTSLVNGTLESGRYTQVRLVVANATGTLQDGSTVDILVPSGVLKVIKSFDIQAGATTSFTMDVHVVKRGQGGYLLQPNVGTSGATRPA